jgi:hypothetical protein
MWRLVFDNVTKRGVDCFRNAKEGEFSVELDKSLCGYFNVTPRRYQYVDGIFSEVEGYLAQQEKDIAFAKKAAELLEERKNRNNFLPFVCDGNNYVNDELNIQGVKIQVLGKPVDDPIPTFPGLPVAGCWKTFDDQFIPFTTTTFQSTLCDTYFGMRSHNFGWYGVLASQLKALYDDIESTKEDIESFDIKTGWHAATIEP